MSSRVHPELERAIQRSTLVERALAYQRFAHGSAGQLRKYTAEPYHVHPEAVAGIVASYSTDEELVAAALLHDVVEDVPGQSVALIVSEFNRRIAGFVDDVTNRFTKELHPGLNRKERKQLERDRLRGVSPGAKLIKLADIIDNTKDLLRHDQKFAKTFFAEKRELLPLLKVEGSDPHHALYEIALRQITTPGDTLG